jgi:hypothetical protein
MFKKKWIVTWLTLDKLERTILCYFLCLDSDDIDNYNEYEVICSFDNEDEAEVAAHKIAIENNVKAYYFPKGT